MGDGGIFFYDFAAPSPVPEPGTWALMLAGVAMVGRCRDLARLIPRAQYLALDTSRLPPRA